MSKRTSNFARDSLHSLAYEVTGSGPPLILLHGLSGSGRWWSRNIRSFAGSFRTYTVDLPGFGQSRRVRWSRLDDIADQLAEWMEQERVPRANVAGHSLGGAVAARLASRHAERVNRLVLVDAAIQPHRARPITRPVAVVRTVSRSAPGFAPLLVRDLLRSHPRSFVAATIDALQTDWESHLSRIIAPTLVIWGERDVITPLSHGYSITETVPDAHMLVMPNAGHNPMWECAETFNVEVLRFLSDQQDAMPNPD